MGPAASLLRWLLLAAVALGSAPGWATPEDDPPTAKDSLGTVERELEKGRRQDRALGRKQAGLEKDLTRLQQRMVTAARTIQRHEDEVARLEDRLRTLAGEEAEMVAGLAADRETFAVVLAALQRLARHPPEALIAQPLSPSDTVRGAILLRAAVPRIERHADGLRNALERLGRTRRDLAARRDELAAVMQELTDERAALDVLLARKAKTLDRTTAQRQAAARRMAALADKAKSLRELMQTMREQEEARPAEPAESASAVRLTTPAPGRPISAARGSLPFPAAGRLVARYGEPAGRGLTRKGMTLETLPAAQVVAPYDGRVVFAGPFRGYGQLLIIDHGEGYHSLLAGLARIDSVIGQWLLAGEPVGVMGRPRGTRPALYVELRRDGRPINPLPWLAARGDKVDG